MASLDILNMEYVGSSENERTENGAILECSKEWTISSLQDWLPAYDFDMLISVKWWLEDDSEISKNGYAKLWIGE